jgi:hypothetical protein
VELSVGKYLTWLVTNMPDHFKNRIESLFMGAAGQ